MNTARAASAAKSGNPLCDKSHVESTLRAMPLATEEFFQCGVSNHEIEVAL